MREMIATAQLVTNRPIPVLQGDRRPGDPPILVGSSEKARQILGWQPKYPWQKTFLPMPGLGTNNAMEIRP
ncbi:hypothetical protein NON20_03540 [Synechocystis sp. B12]|nr:hypothetical protein NON20_03540 [Synechocystis sp. B12]